MSTHCDAATLSLYLDAELPPDEQCRVDRHLNACVPCATQRDQMQAADAALVRWGRVSAPYPLATESRIETSVERRRTRPRFSLSSVVPAAVGSAVAGVLVVVSANVGLLRFEQRITNRLPLPQPTDTGAKQLHAARPRHTRLSVSVGPAAIQLINRSQPPTAN